MKKFCILSDFDGTITKKDGLYGFIEAYAKNSWIEVESLWERGQISSKECLIEEFKLISNLSEDLIENFTKTLEIDEHFGDFYKSISEKNIDFYVVSDGIDCFIDKILRRFGLGDIKVISNHGEFKNGEFKITFPNDYKDCKNNAGTCKCKVLSDLKKKYEKIIYIGDGVSDFCVAAQADILFAKKSLIFHCEKEGIKYIPFKNFSDIKNKLDDICF